MPGQPCWQLRDERDHNQRSLTTLLDLVRRLRRSGTLDIVIDERGGVADVVVRQSVNAAYDTLVTAAARTWKYRPATKDGVPVRFVKTVVLNTNGE